ncbi:MAG TPA: biotin/lipoyl-binding protein [Candidatus Omnitrophica bacterium]|nr:biotin/lipoyl-binding protein [Candidatus Omnitrophota bacterium]
MDIEVKVPETGESEGFTVTYWHFKEGDQVVKDSDLVEISTEKAVFNVSSPVSGILKEKKHQEGGRVSCGDVIAIIDTK